MSRLRLREDVFMAQADGLMIFLDLGGDRYFALSSEVSARLRSVIDANGEGAEEDIVRRLRQARAIAGPQHVGRRFAPTQTHEPRREVEIGRCGRLAAMAAAACRWRAERVLRRRHLADIIRRRNQERLGAIEQEPDQEAIVKAACAFAAARALRGARNACLKEALALLYYLGPRARAADWVFAVKGAPFAAHCWIQLGDIVLNDSVENVCAYTPIMVA